MEKKTISVHAVTIHAYTIAIVLLIAALALLGLKYVHLKLALHGFTQSTITMNETQMNQPVSNVTDYAVIIATTVGQYPQQSKELTQSESLQSYVATLSTTLKRDIVVVDNSQKIVADTIAANRGNTYSQDKEDEVGLTMKDGISRSFVEKSQDYPNGISEVVVPVKNSNNETIGAVILSNFQVTK